MKNKTPESIKDLVKEKYGAIAAQNKQGGGCQCGCGDKNELNYTVFSDDYSELDGYAPDADLGLGCGLPTEYARINPGDTVVDLGSGAGNDCFVARRIVGETGKVIGVDFTSEMVEKAKANNDKLGFKNVSFRLGDIEDLPVAGQTADVVISNCVLNLVPDKLKAFKQIFRVLKNGAHFCVSDVVLVGELPDKLRNEAVLYAGCVSGAVSQEEYLRIIDEAGFSEVAIVKRKQVELPDALLEKLLTSAELEEFKAKELGVFSITVYAEKQGCSCGSC